MKHYFIQIFAGETNSWLSVFIKCLCIFGLCLVLFSCASSQSASIIHHPDAVPDTPQRDIATHGNIPASVIRHR